MQPQPIMAPVAAAALRADLAGLPQAQQLISSGDYAVYMARAAQIPNILNEIGRLREITFRDAREGTGKTVDLDRFDAYYRHLFLWDHQDQFCPINSRYGRAFSFSPFGPGGRGVPRPKYKGRKP